MHRSSTRGNSSKQIMLVDFDVRGQQIDFETAGSVFMDYRLWIMARSNILNASLNAESTSTCCLNMHVCVHNHTIIMKIHPVVFFLSI